MDQLNRLTVKSHLIIHYYL